MSAGALIAGLFLAFAVFSAKTGAGLAYGLTNQRSKKARAIILGGYSLGYLALMAALTWVLTRPYLFDRIKEVFGNVARQGTTVHVCVSLGLLAWGLTLLARRPQKIQASRAWLALVIPCPICLLAIACSMAVLLAYSGSSSCKLVFLAWLVFTGTGLITARLFSAIKSDPDLVLGFAMMAVAIYTLGSIFLGLSMEDARRVFRIARTNLDLAAFNPDKALMAAIASGGAFLGGLIRAVALSRNAVPAQKERKGVDL